MLTDRERTSLLVASTKLEKVRANHMTMKEKLKIHKKIEAESKRKLAAWKEGKRS
jgi:hypothetical protein